MLQTVAPQGASLVGTPLVVVVEGDGGDGNWSKAAAVTPRWRSDSMGAERRLGGQSHHRGEDVLRCSTIGALSSKRNASFDLSRTPSTCWGRRVVVGIVLSDPTAPPSSSPGLTAAAAGSPAARLSTLAASGRMAPPLPLMPVPPGSAHSWAALAFEEVSAAAAAVRGKRRGGARAQNGIFAGVFVSRHKFYVCNFRTKHKTCILAYHNLCFCVFVFLGMLQYG